MFPQQDFNQNGSPPPSFFAFDRALSCFVTILLGCFFTACSPAGHEALEETFEHDYPMMPNGIVRIRNIDGSINIYGSDQPEVHLEVIKRAYTRKRLDTIRTSISEKPESISIESVIPKKSMWDFSDRSGTIEYALTIPQRATVEQLETSNGEIIIEGMRGPKINVRLGNGRVLVRDSFCNLGLTIRHGALTMVYSWWEQAKFSVEASIHQGNTFLFMPGHATFHLMAETGTGKIGADFTPFEGRDGEEPRKIDKVVGTDPAVAFRIQTVDGNIQVSEQNP